MILRVSITRPTGGIQVWYPTFVRISADFEITLGLADGDETDYRPDEWVKAEIDRRYTA